MIFELFIAFLIASLVMVFIGYYTDIKVLAILGFATIFLLGLTLNLSGLTIKTGETVVNAPACSSCLEQRENMTGIPLNFSYIASSTTTYNYVALNDEASLWIGRWLMIVSVLASALVFSSNRDKEDA